jgi:hypothetical protein
VVSLRASDNFNSLLALLLACPGLACFIDNGSATALSDTSTAATTADATTSLTTSTTSTSTGPIDPVTTTGPGDDTADPTTTGVDPDTGTTVDPTAPPLLDCWDQGVAGWPLMGAEISTLLDLNPAYPTLSPDGLTLHYIAGSTRRPFRSIRADLADPFPDGAPIAGWDIPGFMTGYPNVVLGGAELLVSSGQDIHYALLKPDGPGDYDTPELLGATVNTDFEETVLSVTADGQILIVQRNDGPPIGPLAVSWRFYQHERPIVEPGAPFYGMGDTTPLVEPLGLALCPALSPDGSTEDTQLDLANTASLAFYYTTRQTRSDPWGVPQRISGLDTGNAIPCASSLTADGCQLSYFSFIATGEMNTAVTLYLARRAP